MLAEYWYNLVLGSAVYRQLCIHWAGCNDILQLDIYQMKRRSRQI
ncbi:hypothetical protein LSH36_1335g00001 [Paralvinella palmiformis]|uniref:Uncharacterized protein n=1 Tax=Paralvinella palmiformis TaxID=53620 RepID=A0AAD9MQW9_9ANNE|nr:hypothetical protein LSH36_1335g00001 [Paralvinella palmiformis]